MSFFTALGVTLLGAFVFVAFFLGLLDFLNALRNLLTGAELQSSWMRILDMSASELVFLFGAFIIVAIMIFLSIWAKFRGEEKKKREEEIERIATRAYLRREVSKIDHD
jgi:hypothetical protein